MKLKSSDLKMYSTKLAPDTHDLITVLPTVMPKGTGQRELLEDMLRIYEQAYPKRFKAAKQLLAIREAQDEQPQVTFAREDDEQQPVLETDQEPSVKRLNPDQHEILPNHGIKVVQTLKFVGKPKTHLSENGLPACRTPGEIDPDSFEEKPNTAVDCGKCRYSRKAVFE